MTLQSSADETRVSTLYFQFLECWNQQDAHGYAALLHEDAAVVGFDGSQMNGRADVESTISKIFADHKTAAYVGKIREIRLLSPDVALLRAVVGMIPPGKSDLNSERNAIQSLIATRRDDQWLITLFQNTPAQFHGRSDLAAALTKELQALL